MPLYEVTLIKREVREITTLTQDAALSAAKQGHGKLIGMEFDQEHVTEVDLSGDKGVIKQLVELNKRATDYALDGMSNDGGAGQAAQAIKNTVIALNGIGAWTEIRNKAYNAIPEKDKQYRDNGGIFGQFGI